MRIAIVNQHRQDTMGGSELQCDFIAKELTSREYDVRYIAVKGSNKDYNCTYEVLSCKSESKDIIEKLTQLQPDIIYWRYNKNEFYEAAKYSKKMGIRFIFSASHLIDLNPWYFNRNTRFLYTIRNLINRLWQHRGFKYIDALIVNNKEYLNILPVPKQYYIPNGMSTEYVPFTWNKPYILWVANIKQPKRPELFVDLAKEFASKEIDFLMVGAVQEDSYKWIQDKKNLPPNLHYLGPKSFEEVNGMIKESLFHVHTCTAEGFPNIFIQAWVFGKPSVSYGFDPSNYITDYQLGYYSEENWERFVRSVTQLLTDTETRNVCGKNANEFAEKMFKIEKSVSMLEEIIGNLCN